MKHLLLHLLGILFICAAPASGQQPTQDTIPQLKEWWRTDVLKYGKYGMTWLDNFYQGKGALVVYTSEGVKTWLLRFPGDTMNVFSWEKGSSNIKTGDFNGDGITDYVDENGYIYEGIKNGEPPKPEISGQGFNPSLVSDINGDGYDDMLAASAVIFGKKDLSSLKIETFTLPDVDSNNAPIGSYMVSRSEMYIVCRHYYWTNIVKYPFKIIYKEGLRLVRVWWDVNGFKSQTVDEFTIDVSGPSYSGGVLMKQSKSKVYWIGSTNGNLLTVYNLSNNKFEKMYTQAYNGGVVGTLRHSIDNDSTHDFYILGQRTDGVRTIILYSGNIDNDLHPICEFTTVQIAAVASIGDVTGDGKPELALSNYYIVSSREKYRFSILTTQDTTSSVESESANASTFSIQTISPMPVSKDKNVQIKVRVPQAGSYTVYFYDTTGKKIPGKSENYQLSGEAIINLTIGDYGISSGMYRVQVEGDGRTSHCSIIIQ
jgi:hypothetical protein